MYFPTLEAATVRLARLVMTPTRTRHFRVNRAPEADALWLEAMLNREGAKLGTRVARRPDGTLDLVQG
jgi:poly-gamma-glutamate synthesis protein (capsule biosynthesis protein)